MPRIQTDWLPTEQLMTAFHPLNPIQHEVEGDVKDLALSLLEGGWVEPITLNQRNGRLVGGHGRVEAANWLMQQSESWFEHRSQMWTAYHEGGVSDEERFTSEYWQKALVLLVDLSEPEHEAMLIRLNDTESQGKDDPEKLKALLSQLPGRLKQLAGYREAIAPEPQPTEEFQDKQRFESSGAIDYRVADAPDPDTAEYASGDVTEYHDPDEEGEWIEDEEEEPAEPKAPPPVRALSVSLTWAQWKLWNTWKRENDISKDTDAFVKGHDAYLEPEEPANA